MAALYYPKVQRFCVAFVLAITSIWRMERTIAINTVGAGENAWTYGQIFSAVLTVVPVVQLLQMWGVFAASDDIDDLKKKKRD